MVRPRLHRVARVATRTWAFLTLVGWALVAAAVKAMDDDDG